MRRRTFLSSLFALTLPAASFEKRDLRKIVADIGYNDAAYNKTEELIVKRAKYFAPDTDAIIKGWARRESVTSHKVGDLWEEFAQLGE